MCGAQRAALRLSARPPLAGCASPRQPPPPATGRASCLAMQSPAMGSLLRAPRLVVLLSALLGTDDGEPPARAPLQGSQRGCQSARHPAGGADGGSTAGGGVQQHCRDRARRDGKRPKPCGGESCRREAESDAWWQIQKRCGEQRACAGRRAQAQRDRLRRGRRVGGRARRAEMQMLSALCCPCPPPKRPCPGPFKHVARSWVSRQKH